MDALKPCVCVSQRRELDPNETPPPEAGYSAQGPNPGFVAPPGMYPGVAQGFGQSQPGPNQGFATSPGVYPSITQDPGQSQPGPSTGYQGFAYQGIVNNTAAVGGASQLRAFEHPSQNRELLTPSEGLEQTRSVATPVVVALPSAFAAASTSAPSTSEPLGMSHLTGYSTSLVHM